MGRPPRHQRGGVGPRTLMHTAQASAGLLGSRKRWNSWKHAHTHTILIAFSLKYIHTLFTFLLSFSPTHTHTHTHTHTRKSKCWHHDLGDSFRNSGQQQ